MIDIQKNKNMFLSLCRTFLSERPGLDELLAWLEQSDFFTAPASSRYHLCEAGGLCRHSLNVYDELLRLSTAYSQYASPAPDSMVASALFHDLCKVNFYKPDSRNVKVDGVWTSVPYYSINELSPYGGHGSKSVFLVQKFMPLTFEEASAINCHMGLSEHERSISDVYRRNPLAWLLHVADEAAAFILESREGLS